MKKRKVNRPVARRSVRNADDREPGIDDFDPSVAWTSIKNVFGDDAQSFLTWLKCELFFVEIYERAPRAQSKSASGKELLDHSKKWKKTGTELQVFLDSATFADALRALDYDGQRAILRSVQSARDDMKELSNLSDVAAAKLGTTRGKAGAPKRSRVLFDFANEVASHLERAKCKPAENADRPFVQILQLAKAILDRKVASLKVKPRAFPSIQHLAREVIKNRGKNRR